MTEMGDGGVLVLGRPTGTEGKVEMGIIPPGKGAARLIGMPTETGMGTGLPAYTTGKFIAVYDFRPVLIHNYGQHSSIYVNGPFSSGGQK